MPGMAMSRIRQQEAFTNSDSRNASADGKAIAAKPSCSSKSGRDSRTDSSSSTNDTSERVAVSFALRSVMSAPGWKRSASVAVPAEDVRAPGRQTRPESKEDSSVLWYRSARAHMPRRHGMENANVAPGAPSFGSAQ